MADDVTRQRIFGAIAAKVVALGGIAHAVGGIEDHVHLVATAPLNLALSQFIGQVKGSSSHMASRLVDGYVEPFEWQAEYGVLTVSESHLAKVVHYALNQKQHHAENALDMRLERIE
jgi:REP element-mobilizing transposase RayT